MICCQENIFANNLVEISNYSIEKDFECCAVKIGTNDIAIGITTIYRSPTGDIKIFLKAAATVLERLSRMCNYVVLCGDINIDLLRDTHERKLLLDLFECFNLKISTHEPTRIFTKKNNVTTSSAIDYVVTNLPAQSYTTLIIHTLLSDHCAVTMRISGVID